MRFRAFVSVDISPNDSLAALLEYLKGSVASLKVVKPSNMHLTLKFLGDTEEALVEDIVKAIADSTRGRKPFEVRLRGMGAFPSLSNIRVVWVGMENGSELVELAEGLEDSLAAIGLERDKRGFKPHLTVARSKGIITEDTMQDFIAANAATDYGDYAVDGVILKKSVLTPQGPIYSDVRGIKLGGQEEDQRS
ncbi:MAG TPA: RNA 2',3'-cyclic phosphodiesterase [Thermoplasmata archaeon]|nr:RNA 2',3'-cyclic phosphodiesterase [Thermoplasmata archaeon]